MDLKPFLKSLFDSFMAELHSKDVDSLQKEIAEGFLTYFGHFKDGDLFILDDGEISRLSPYELSEELPFRQSQIESFLNYTRSIHLDTSFLYSGVKILPGTKWAIGGIGSILNDLISGKVSFFTFPVHVEFTPSVGISYDISITLSYVLGEGIYLKANPDCVRDLEGNKIEKNPDKKYTGYYASIDGSMDAHVVIDKFNLNFNRGNIIKYVIRAGKKDASKEIEDLEKAKKYIDFEIKRLNGEIS